MLVLTLYRMYREQEKSFVSKYLKLLEAGGSNSPEELLKPLGADFPDPGFWQKGFDEIRGLVQRVERLADKVNR